MTCLNNKLVASKIQPRSWKREKGKRFFHSVDRKISELALFGVVHVLSEVRLTNVVCCCEVGCFGVFR